MTVDRSRLMKWRENDAARLRRASNSRTGSCESALRAARHAVYRRLHLHHLRRGRTRLAGLRHRSGVRRSITSGRVSGRSDVLPVISRRLVRIAAAAAIADGHKRRQHDQSPFHKTVSLERAAATAFEEMFRLAERRVGEDDKKPLRRGQGHSTPRIRQPAAPAKSRRKTVRASMALAETSVPDLRQDLLHHLPGHVSEPEVAAVVAVGQALVVHSQEV